MFRRITALAGGAVLTIALALGLAGTAHGNPAGVGITQNTAGVAGYYANDNGHTRFRDVRADVTVTPQIKFLNGPGGQGALGVELCDPNSGYAGQLGIWWNAGLGKYQVVYAAGTLNMALADPCIMTGLITPTPQQLLSAFTISPGDHLHFEIYWNPVGVGLAHLHFFHFNVCDTTLDVCRQAQISTGWRNFYEAGIGAVSNANLLTAPALNFLDTFTRTAFNYYSSTHLLNTIYSPGHWPLKQADFVNASSQLVMSSNGSLDGGGHTFTLSEGSTSP